MKLLTGPAVVAPATELLRAYVVETARRLGAFGADLDVSVEARCPDTAVGYEADGRPVACVVVRTLAPGIAEIKRMYVRPEHRGRGAGAALLAAAEALAAERGAHTVRLDTAAPLAEALRLYRRHGYREIARYNDNPSATHWLEKRLTAHVAR